MNEMKRPKYGGRQKGTPNKATATIREIAGQYTQEAIDTLVNVMRNGETMAVKRAAANDLLDRGYGKPRLEPEPTEPENEQPQQITIQFVEPRKSDLK